MIILRKIVDEMVEHARKEEPFECCGLLIGSDAKIDEILRCTNQERSRVEFSVPPLELFDAFRDIRLRRRQLLGIYHSHPCSPAYPSEKDLEEYHYHDVDCWIVSLQNRSPVVRCFRWKDNNFRETRFQVR